MYNFCGLLDVRYLTRFLVLYRSLKNLKVDLKFYLWVLDDEVHNLLQELNLDNCILITKKELHFRFDSSLAPDSSLINYNSNSKLDYSYMNFTILIDYVLKKIKQGELCIYTDMDILYVRSPIDLMKDFLASNKSILLNTSPYGRAFEDSLPIVADFLAIKKSKSTLLFIEDLVDQSFNPTFELTEEPGSWTGEIALSKIYPKYEEAIYVYAPLEVTSENLYFLHFNFTFITQLGLYTSAIYIEDAKFLCEYVNILLVEIPNYIKLILDEEVFVLDNSFLDSTSSIRVSDKILLKYLLRKDLNAIKSVKNL